MLREVRIPKGMNSIMPSLPNDGSAAGIVWKNFSLIIFPYVIDDLLIAKATCCVRSTEAIDAY